MKYRALVKVIRSTAAQMQGHGASWWKANAVEDVENPIAMILCSDRYQTAVEIATAGMAQKIFVSHYLVAFPAMEKLRRFLEADSGRIESSMPASAARERAPRQAKS